MYKEERALLEGSRSGMKYLRAIVTAIFLLLAAIASATTITWTNPTTYTDNTALDNTLIVCRFYWSTDNVVWTQFYVSPAGATTAAFPAPASMPRNTTLWITATAEIDAAYPSAKNPVAILYIIESPVLTSPVNLATVTRPVTFQWQAVSGATKYNLEVDDNSDFSSPEVDIETVNTSYTVAVGILSPARTYYWHVRAYK